MHSTQKGVRGASPPRMSGYFRMEQIDLMLARRADDIPPRFVRLLHDYSAAAGLRFVHCGSHDQAEALRAAVEAGDLRIGCLIDYMGGSFRRDYEFACAVKDSGGLVVDDPELVRLYGDKAVMHHALSEAGLEMPRTVILRSWQPTRALTAAERILLGQYIVVKPARGSGASGVVLGCDGSAEAIAAARDHDPDDHFLLQEYIEPVDLGGRPAWFRVYSCFGRIGYCFWHPHTHETIGVSAEEHAAYGLDALSEIAQTIGRVSGYTWFSCEVALTRRDGRLCWLPIDYLNNKCYLLAQSEVGARGVPDIIVDAVIRELVDQEAHHAAKLCR